MSRGPGATQRFILAELDATADGEWAVVADLADRLAGGTATPTLNRSVRAACHRLEVRGLVETGIRVVVRTEMVPARPFRPMRRKMSDGSRAILVDEETGETWGWKARPAREHQVWRRLAAVRRLPSPEVVAREAAEAEESMRRLRELFGEIDQLEGRG